MAKRWVIGIDEVGRGPLAGPITVAAVATAMLPRTVARTLRGIKDSKKLSEKQRREWVEKIQKVPMVFALSSVGPGRIDRIGVARAARVAVGRCLRHLEAKLPRKSVASISQSTVLLDGSLYAPRTYPNQKTIIRGDEKIPLIAAASIIAKVRRDRAMCRLAQQYPHYQLEIHKGYGTRAHRAQIQRLGLSSVHRATFCSRLV